MLNARQFSQTVGEDFLMGPEYGSTDFPKGGLPAKVFRVMSEEHYQNSVASGTHTSDGRNNWQAQGHSDSIDEGTVGSAEAHLGYLPEGGTGRLVQFDNSEGHWQQHPEVEDYVRATGPVPMSTAIYVSPEIKGR